MCSKTESSDTELLGREQCRRYRWCSTAAIRSDSGKDPEKRRMVEAIGESIESQERVIDGLDLDLDSDSDSERSE